MSNIPSVKEYIQIENTYARKPVSEELAQTIGGSLNFMLDIVGTGAWVLDTFTANGTWTCPAGITRVFIYGCGGGGGGACGTVYGGDAGGAASIPHLVNLAVTPSASYAVGIGTFGAGSIYSTITRATNGGDTTFGSLYKYYGGSGGDTVVKKKHFYQSSNATITDGMSFSIYTGGAGGVGSGTQPLVGGGGAALGNGGNGSVYATEATPGSGYGSGGGAGNHGFGGAAANGDNGAPGILYVFYSKPV